jgi:hypothetical protein
LRGALDEEEEEEDEEDEDEEDEEDDEDEDEEDATSSPSSRYRPFWSTGLPSATNSSTGSGWAFCRSARDGVSPVERADGRWNLCSQMRHLLEPKALW